MSRMKPSRRYRVMAVAVILLAILVIGGQHAYAPRQPANSASKKAIATPKTTSSSSVPASAFNQAQFSKIDPASIWIVTNKHHQLTPSSYAPSDLVVPNIRLRSTITTEESHVRQVTATALQALFSAAKTDGVDLDLQSGYRSYAFQTTLYNGYVSQQGQVVADTQSARPGYSEHQTGLAADIGGVTSPDCNISACFATTPEGIWLAAEAYRYGFIIRYPQDQTAVTGYAYEPWHVRYIGEAAAAEMHSAHVPDLETFFGLGAAPDYR